jgi:hypothetical protein
MNFRGFREAVAEQVPHRFADPAWRDRLRDSA